MDQNELKKRTKQFALRILKLTAALPKTVEAKVDALLKEANELTAIMTASRKTAQSKK